MTFWRMTLGLWLSGRLGVLITYALMRREAIMLERQQMRGLVSELESLREEVSLLAFWSRQ